MAVEQPTVAVIAPASSAGWRGRASTRRCAWPDRSCSRRTRGGSGAPASRGRAGPASPDACATATENRRPKRRGGWPGHPTPLPSGAPCSSLSDPRRSRWRPSGSTASTSATSASSRSTWRAMSAGGDAAAV